MSKRARQTALNFINAVNSKDAQQLAQLFADDAQLQHPDQQLEGKDAITGFYTQQQMPQLAELTLNTVFSENDYAAAEVELRFENSDTPRAAATIFRVDDTGKILELSVYYR